MMKIKFKKLMKDLKIKYPGLFDKTVWFRKFLSFLILFAFWMSGGLFLYLYYIFEFPYHT